MTTQQPPYSRIRDGFFWFLSNKALTKIATKKYIDDIFITYTYSFPMREPETPIDTNHARIFPLARRDKVYIFLLKKVFGWLPTQRYTHDLLTHYRLGQIMQHDATGSYSHNVLAVRDSSRTPVGGGI